MVLTGFFVFTSLIMETKTCFKCKTEKCVQDFSKDKTRSDGLHPYCKSCRRDEKLKAYYSDIEKHRSKSRENHHKFREQRNEKQRQVAATLEGKAAARRSNLLKLYGLTQESYDDMRKEQNYCCFICEKHESVVRKGNSSRNATALHVDHCHDTGKVRGLLCTNCNTLLGKAGDSVKVLNKAIEYLERNNK